MEVKVAKSAGFCAGVKSAFNKALELAEKYGKIYTVGELVHNELVTDFLQSKGVKAITIEQARQLNAGDVVLIRAHGIPKADEDYIRSRGVTVFDATCPVVKKVHNIVTEQHENGKSIVIVGDRNHDEVTGTASYGGDDVKIFSEKETIEITDKPTAVVFQTTILADKYKQICEYIQNSSKISNNLVGIFNTICYTTKARQDEARLCAEMYDAVLVLGSRNSANTMRIFQVAKEVNKNTFFVENIDDAVKLKEKNIKMDFQCISIVGGASTPPWLIQEVFELMSETQKTVADSATIENEVTNVTTLQEQTKAAENIVPEKELTMEDVMASNRSVGYTNYKVGKRIKGTVIRADEAGIFMAIGGKKDGFIDKADAAIDGNYNPADYNAGDPIEACISSVNKDYVSLSKKEIDALRLEEAEAEKALCASEFKLKMTEVVKGGLRGRLGSYTVFVPASQIKMGYVKNLEDYKDKELRLTLMPPKEKEVPEVAAEAVEGAEVAVDAVDGAEVVVAEVAAAPVETPVANDDRPAKKSKYLFASQRMILEKEKMEKEDLFWNNIHVHDIVVGKVKRFTAFGAFVNVRGFDCLAHISELSWNKISDPASVLTIGENYDFVVLKMDRETGKISLGFKQLQKKPYEVAAETYPVGTIIKGKVERIFPYGAFISIADGVDGLVHVSQISHNWIKDASEALTVGAEVDAKIIGFEDNRITLSIKELLPVPEETEASNNAEDNVADDPALTEAENLAKKQSRVKKFEQKVADGEVKRDRRPRRDNSNSNEPKEWVSGNSTASLGATLGDLFKNLK
ncbi:MAG: 4-hydroxy-3-methylbut-2-enyl diphosphate reductase, partial [Clostridia bacterium]